MCASAIKNSAPIRMILLRAITIGHDVGIVIAST